MTRESSRAWLLRPAARRAAGRSLLAAAVAGCVLGLAVFGAAPGHSQSARIKSERQLLQQFHALDGLSAEFREEKRVALLVVPLVSEGAIYFARPGTLARHTTRPSSSTIVVDSGQIAMRSGQQVQRLSVSTHPAIGPLVNALLYLFSGDEAALRKSLASTFEPETEKEPWRLELRPRDPAAAKLVSLLVLRGRGLKVHTLYLKEGSGDESTTTFSNHRIPRSYSSGERRTLLSIGS